MDSFKWKVVYKVHIQDSISRVIVIRILEQTVVLADLELEVEKINQLSRFQPA